MWVQSTCLLVVGLIGATVAVGPTTANPFKCFESAHCIPSSDFTPELSKCTSQWGAFPRVESETNELLVQQLRNSFEYLLTASYFKEWKYNRPGFASYFSKLSDSNWDEAMSLLIHMVERGGSLKNFKIDMSDSSEYKINEINALTKALDTEKRTAHKTLHLAHLANHGAGVPHDSEFAHFLSERLHHNSVLRIKHLANYVKLLSDLVMEDKDSGYAIFKFDSEYLK